MSEFTFDWSEIESLGMERAQWSFMEKIAREDLQRNGLPYIGGNVEVELGYDMQPTVMTISIGVPHEK